MSKKQFFQLKPLHSRLRGKFTVQLSSQPYLFLYCTMGEEIKNIPTETLARVNRPYVNFASPNLSAEWKQAFQLSYSKFERIQL